MTALVACSDTSDAGAEGRDGYTLTDIAPDAEAMSVTPSSVVFEDVEAGETDVWTVTVANQSTAELSLTNVALIDTDPSVRFANLFLQNMGQLHRWVDSDGDGHTFESRPAPIVVEAGQSIEVVVQYRPDGSPLTCRDRPPAPCGYLILTGIEQIASVAIHIPR